MGYLDNSGLAYFWGKVKALINAKAPTSHASTATTYGVANASKYGHAKASGTTPKALGTAAVGSETAAFARGDHVHPMPTAEQVGARPDTWTPTAADVGALAAGGTAANANMLGGVAAYQYALKSEIPAASQIFTGVVVVELSEENPSTFVSANVPSGRTFLGWLAPATQGWIGTTYISDVTAQSSGMFWVKGTGGNVNCAYMYY